MAKNRNYSYKDVDMLMASRTIAESFRANIAELSVTRTVWTEQYANDLITRIDSAIGNNIGIDAKKDLRAATSTLAGIQAPARRDVSFFKRQISEDFKKDPARRDEILTNLGFTRYFKDVMGSNQEALMQLLYAFKTNMTEALRTEITAKGMNPILITNITGYADTFREANVAQESFKGTSKNITFGIQETFNAIYDEIISICKIATGYYKYEPLKKEQFTFSKVIANLGTIRKTKSTPTEPVTT